MDEKSRPYRALVLPNPGVAQPRDRCVSKVPASGEGPSGASLELELVFS
jgi:hypothetical protein